jgi:hypothetical protein
MNANFYGLMQMLAEVNHSFSLIGLTETKYKVSEDIVYAHSMPGYCFISQPSLSNAGGVGFFVYDQLSFHVRNDLSVSTNDYECLWVNIQSNFNYDLICGVIYSHPNSDLEAFLVYLNKVMDIISRENNCCIIMETLI